MKLTKKIIIAVLILIAFCVILLLCKKNKSVSIPKTKLDKIVNEYVDPISSKASSNGKTFCDYKVIDSEENKNTIKIYMNVLGQEYYLKDNKLTQGTGGVFPAVLVVQRENDDYKYISCNISKLMESSEADKIFPEFIRKKAMKNETFDSSSIEKIKKNAEDYFSKNLKS